MVTSGSESYTYNGDGVLVERDNGLDTTEYLQDLAAPLSQVLAVGGLYQVYGHERLLAISGVGSYWYTHDGLGSLRATLNSTGDLLSETRYDPFGVP